MRRWYLGLGHDPERHSTRVLVPVSRRTRAGEVLHGNQLSGYLVTLPLSEPDPLVRLFRVRESMAACKDHGPSRGAGAVATLPELLPAGVQRFTGPLLRPTAPLLFDALATDVPIPGLPFTLGGAPLAAVHPSPARPGPPPRPGDEPLP
ncbi:WS/DGAT domain-containing protein [Streptacidiphilus monticola]